MINTIGSTILSLLLASAGALAGAAPSRVTGTLVGADGAPMTVAHAHVGRPLETPVASVPVDRDGRFSLTTTERGLVVLTLTGVGHSALEVPLWLAGGDAIALRANLGTPRLRDTLEAVKVTGEFNQFSRKSGKTMTKQPDGTYVLEVASDKPFRYQLLGVRSDATCYEGQTADAFEWGEQIGRTGHYEGDYRAVLRPRHGKVRIVFDPARLPRSPKAGRAIFVEASSISAALSDYEGQRYARREPYALAIMAHYKAGKPMDAFAYDWSPAVDAIRTALRREPPTPVREALTLELWSLCHESSVRGGGRPACDEAEMPALLDRMPPESTVWGWMAGKDGVLGALVKRTIGDPRVRPYVTRFLDNQPSRQVKAQFLYYTLALADEQGGVPELAEYHRRLVREYPESIEARRAAAAYAPDRRIRPGQPLPAFSVPSLNDASVALTNASAAGKLLLIDVWTTWCPGCRIGMPTLHSLYEKHRAAGLEMLGVSGDDAAGDVREFRAAKDTPMPWLQAYIGPVRDSPLMKLFEVSGYPTYILVDRDGTILLKSHEHEEVEAAVLKALGRGTAP